MIRIISDATGYTCFERVERVDEHSPLFLTVPGDEIQQVTNLQILKGRINSDQINESLIDYVLFGNDLFDDIKHVSVDDIKPEAIDDELDPVVARNDLSQTARYSQHIAVGNLSKFGTYYINSERCLVVPGECIKIITDMDIEQAKSIFFDVFTSFNVAYTPLARNLKLQPVKSYRMANITVEYVNDSQMRMSGLEMLAFDKGVLKAIKINGQIKIPALPIINSDNYDKVFSMRKFDNFNVSIDINQVEDKPVVPIDSNKTNAQIMLDQYVKYIQFEIPKGKYYTTGQFPLLAPKNLAEFMVLTTEKPERSYFNVYFNCTSIGVQPDGFLYYEELVDQKLKQFLDRLQIIQYETVSQMLDTLLQLKKDYVNNISEYFKNKMLELSGIRKANTLRYKIPNIPQPYFDTNLRNFESLNWDYKTDIDSIINEKFQGPYQAAMNMFSDESLPSKFEEKWRSEIAGYTTKHTSYEYWKGSDTSSKERARFLLDERFSFEIKESHKGVQPQLIIDVEFPHIVKTICLRNRGMDENAQLSRDDLCLLAKNIAPMVLSHDYIESITAEVDYNPHHRKCHDWYDFLGAFPEYTDVDTVVKARYIITFNSLNPKFIDIKSKNSEFASEFARTIGSNLTNAPIDIIFNDQLKDNLQVKISSDADIRSLVDQLMLVFDGKERRSLYLRCGKDYFSPNINLTPFSITALLDPEKKIELSDAMLSCTIPYKGVDYSIESILKKFSLSIETDRSQLARNYLYLPDSYQEDLSGGTLLLSHLFSNIKLEDL